MGVDRMGRLLQIGTAIDEFRGREDYATVLLENAPNSDSGIERGATRLPAIGRRRAGLALGCPERSDPCGFTPERRFTLGVWTRRSTSRVGRCWSLRRSVRWLRPEEEILVLETIAVTLSGDREAGGPDLMRLTEIRELRREYVKILRSQLESHDKDWAFPNHDGRPYSRVHGS